MARRYSGYGGRVKLGSGVPIDPFAKMSDQAYSFFRHVGTLRWRPWSVIQRFKFNKKVNAMDEYQEELLEYRASELDPVEPADDATEL